MTRTEPQPRIPPRAHDDSSYPGDHLYEPERVVDERMADSIAAQKSAEPERKP